MIVLKLCPVDLRLSSVNVSRMLLDYIVKRLYIRNHEDRKEHGRQDLKSAQKNIESFCGGASENCGIVILFIEKDLCDVRGCG